MENSRVWSRFTRTMKDGSVKKFRIQEIPSNMYDDVWNFTKEYFLTEEPLSVIFDILNDPVSLTRDKNFWTKYALPQNISVMCIEDKQCDSKTEIVGINYFLHCIKGKDKRPEGCAEPDPILRMFDAIYEDFSVFEHFGVTEYLGDAGLTVNPKYRGMGIGLELLLARQSLCKQYGFKLTETLFTALSSQALAAKAGFTTVIEKTYKELGEKLKIDVPEKYTVCKVMIKKYD